MLLRAMVFELLDGPFPDGEKVHLKYMRSSKNPVFNEIGVQFRIVKDPNQNSGDSGKRPILGANSKSVEPPIFDYTFRVRSGREVEDFPSCKVDFYDFMEKARIRTDIS